MPQRSASTLDEETALAVALSISKEDSHSSHPSTKDAAGIIGRGERSADIETGEQPLADASASTGLDESTEAGGSTLDTSPLRGDLSGDVQAGDVQAIASTNQAFLDRIQGAKTRRHIPRRNSLNWSRENSIGDKERLLANLALYDLAQKEVKGDGNCQFRALSDQMYQTPKFYSEVRQQIHKQLKAQPQLYADFSDDEYHSYVSHMAKDGTWGDHITLQAAADVYGIRILIVSSYQEECIIEILPHTPEHTKTLFLSFWHEVHYGSIYPSGSPIPEETPKTFGSKHLYRFIHKPPTHPAGVLHI